MILLHLLNILLLINFVISHYNHNPHFFPGRTTIVHLFEWKWKDIANECEQFLGPKGYGGVQLSPVNENIILKNRPWFERYQPISYKLTTRSGTITELTDMINRCNKVGVRIYVDAVLNHMARNTPNNTIGIGTGNSTAHPDIKDFPAVPYSNDDFHPTCQIVNYQNPDEVRTCELEGLKDLNHVKPHVQERILNYLNNLIRMGVAGFRIDAAKHMYPKDLSNIYYQMDKLNENYDFPKNSKPFIFQEVIDLGTEPIKKTDYNFLGVVTEFLHSMEIGKAFRSANKLKWLKNWGPEWNFLPSEQSLIFIDNHDNQRGHGAGGADILTHKNQTLYKLATAFMLAHPYGYAEVMSSYKFTTPEQGPPADRMENIISPSFHSNGYCTENSGWICEHRWMEISNMVKFRNICNGTKLTNWWDNDNNQIAFGRENKGFIIINNEKVEMLNQILQTNLPTGIYCNVFDGMKNGGKCTGQKIQISNDGKINIDKLNGQSAIALHIGVSIIPFPIQINLFVIKIGLFLN